MSRHSGMGGGRRVWGVPAMTCGGRSSKIGQIKKLSSIIRVSLYSVAHQGPV
jgi:hypothetical protein